MKKKKRYHINGLYIDHTVGQLSPEKQMTKEEFRVWYSNTQTEKKRKDVTELRINR